MKKSKKAATRLAAVGVWVLLPLLGLTIWMIAAAPDVDAAVAADQRKAGRYTNTSSARVVESESDLREEAHDGAIAVPDEQPGQQDQRGKDGRQDEDSGSRTAEPPRTS